MFLSSQQSTIKDNRQTIRGYSRTSVGVYPLPSYLFVVRFQHLSHYISRIFWLSISLSFFVSDFGKRYLALHPEAESTTIAVFPRVPISKGRPCRFLYHTLRGIFAVPRGSPSASTFGDALYATSNLLPSTAFCLYRISKMSYSELWRAATRSQWPYGPIQRAIVSGRLIQMIIPDPNMSVAAQAIELVRRLNDPRYAAGASQISRELQEIQLSDQGWAAADAMLDHADANIKFYGALTLQIKLNKDRLVSLTTTTCGSEY
jgi:hypothetical protein